MSLFETEERLVEMEAQVLKHVRRDYANAKLVKRDESNDVRILYEIKSGERLVGSVSIMKDNRAPGGLRALIKFSDKGVELV